jgi:hypothetical protein
MTGSTIKTDYDHSAEQWVAWFDGQKRDPNAARGSGYTERAAIIRLFNEAEDKMPPDEPAPLNDGEIMILRGLCGKNPGIAWGSWVSSALESLYERGYVTGGPLNTVTDAGRAALKAIEEKRT